jgi:hypothetical protein
MRDCENEAASAAMGNTTFEPQQEKLGKASACIYVQASAVYADKLG